MTSHGSTLAAALRTVNARHDATDHLHANLLTRCPFGDRICWSHIGFWGSESLYCPNIDLAASFTINQSEPHNPETLRMLVSAVADALEAVSEKR